MAGVAMRMLVLMLLTFKKVKLIFGHPVPCPRIQTRWRQRCSHSMASDPGPCTAIMDHTCSGWSSGTVKRDTMGLYFEKWRFRMKTRILPCSPGESWPCPTDPYTLFVAESLNADLNHMHLFNIPLGAKSKPRQTLHMAVFQNGRQNPLLTRRNGNSWKTI